MHRGGGCGHGGEVSGRARRCSKRMSDDHDDGYLADEKVRINRAHAIRWSPFPSKSPAPRHSPGQHRRELQHRDRWMVVVEQKSWPVVPRDFGSVVMVVIGVIRVCVMLKGIAWFPRTGRTS
jgi:hypothetical protein